MSSTTWWILVGSVILAILIMITSFSITWIKVKKVKEKYAMSNQNIESMNNQALQRPNGGELLWDLKKKSPNPLDDSQMEFLINTALRNKYKSFVIINSFSDYEKTTLIKIAKMKENKTKSDLTVVFNNNEINEVFDKIFKQIEVRKMVAIVNAPRRNKEIKKLINYLRLTKVKYEWVNIGQGIILIVA